MISPLLVRLRRDIVIRDGHIIITTSAPKIPATQKIPAVAREKK